MKKTSIEWKIERRAVKSLIPADYNPRKMTESERRDLEDSIKEFGTVSPLAINIGKREGVLIGGHQRTTIYADLGIEWIDVMVPSRELNEEEEKRLNLRLNKNTGSWDMEKLKDMDLGMLLDVGFGDEELSTLWDDVDVIDDEFDFARAVRQVKEPRIKPGEVYQLGSHRLMCGDSTDPEQVKKLMGEDLADVIFTDPPYNIGLDYSKGVGTGGKYQGEYSAKKDSKTKEGFSAFLRNALGNALGNAKPNCHVFVWCDERYIWLLQTLFAEHKVENKRVCLWIKNNMSPTPQVAFNKCYEPCVYGTRGKPTLNKNIQNLNEIMNKEISTGNQGMDDILEMINLWMVKRDNTQSYEHPTQKPVTLAERPLKRCSSPGQIVLDLFGGSGSTLIACEQIKRKCRMIEQDPIFATVILDRWEQFTNQKVKKVSTREVSARDLVSEKDIDSFPDELDEVEDTKK